MNTPAGTLKGGISQVFVQTSNHRVKNYSSE